MSVFRTASTDIGKFQSCPPAQFFDGPAESSDSLDGDRIFFRKAEKETKGPYLDCGSLDYRR